MQKITKEQFVEKSLKSSARETRLMIEMGFVPIPCGCNYEKCEGWKWAHPRADTHNLNEATK